VTDQLFYPGIPVSSTNKTEILLKMAFNTIDQPSQPTILNMHETFVTGH
jgi:hypothetical protein